MATDEIFEGPEDDLPIFNRDTKTVLGGVSVTWLCELFNLDKKTINRRLVGLKPCAYTANEAPLFSLKEAAARLVDPVIDIEKYLNTMTAAKLPTALRNEFWQAKISEQKYRIEAGELWYTEDVHRVFSDFFLAIKDQMKLWPMTLAAASVDGLSSKQREMFQNLVDGLQRDLSQRVENVAKTRETLNQLDKDQEILHGDA
jgi:hypothetical protein